MATDDLLWPACDGPEDLPRIGEIPLESDDFQPAIRRDRPGDQLGPNIRP